MKKRIKNIISLVLVIALAISGITYTTETKADEKEDSWKTNAVHGTHRLLTVPYLLHMLSWMSSPL